jgi:hypothetical protein
MISVHTQGDMISLCALDLWNVFKDARARYDEFKARTLDNHGVCPVDDARSYISGHTELCPEAGFQLASVDADDDARSDVTVTAAPTGPYFTSSTSLISFSFHQDTNSPIDLSCFMENAQYYLIPRLCLASLSVKSMNASHGSSTTCPTSLYTSHIPWWAGTRTSGRETSQSGYSRVGGMRCPGIPTPRASSRST